ncbi:MAG: hypothetical protein EOM59_18225 [Clostridia bacterium]|nr:hypothetical protein [Clostridia bacterium]
MNFGTITFIRNTSNRI